MSEASGPRQILVVDDDPDLLRMVQRILTAYGHTVFTRPSAFGVLSAAVQNQVDLIIVDVMMPLLSGIDCVGLLRSDARTARTPIIVYSSASEVMLSEVAARNPDVHVLAKGRLRALVHAVNEVTAPELAT